MSLFDLLHQEMPLDLSSDKCQFLSIYLALINPLAFTKALNFFYCYRIVKGIDDVYMTYGLLNAIENVYNDFQIKNAFMSTLEIRLKRNDQSVSKR